MSMNEPANSELNERQKLAVGWLIAFLVCLFGVLALPLFSGGESAVSADTAEIGPFVLFGAVVLGLGLLGRRSPTLSGVSSGITVLVSIVLMLVITISLLFTSLFSDNTFTPDWGGGLYATIAACACGFVAVVVSGRGWVQGSPRGWTPIMVGGAAASVAMVFGTVIPRNGLSLSDTLGFSVHPIVGISFTLFLAALGGVGVAGFAMGRWGIGLVGGFLGFILFGWLTSGDGQSATFGWSGVDGGADYHAVTVVGFWSALILFVMHVVQQFSTSPQPFGSLTERLATPVGQTAADEPASRSTVAPPTGKRTPGRWAPDPFGRFDHRYFNGSEWTSSVAKDGVTSSDDPTLEPPLDGTSAWHPDPLQRHQYRYFNGRDWTRHVSDDGLVTTDDLRPDPPPLAPTEAAGFGSTDASEATLALPTEDTEGD